MLALHRHPTNGRPSGATNVVALANAVLAWPARVIEYRRLMSQMAGMSDRELRDIGLLRQDVVDATAVDYDRDPSELLVVRVGERRRWSQH